jgi:predicted dehydrogenase
MTGGAVVDLHIHDLDLLNWLFGQPQRVFARGIQGETGGWDHVITQVEYERVTACAEASFLMPQDFPFTAGLRILCEGGVIEYHFRASGASFETGQPAHYLCLHEPGKPNQPIAFDQGDAFERELAYFVACVRDNQPPAVVTLADARLALQTALAARDSLETGQPIRVEV